MNIRVLCKWVAVIVTLFLLILWHPRFVFAEEAPTPIVLAFAKKSPELFPEGRAIEACVPVPANLVQQLYDNVPYRVLYFSQMILELISRFDIDIIRIELSESEICVYYATHVNNDNTPFIPPHS